MARSGVKTPAQGVRTGHFARSGTEIEGTSANEALWPASSSDTLGKHPEKAVAMKLELVTFKLCPFGQRVQITLLEKQLAFETRFVDLKRLPAWLGALSPHARVPVLRVDGQTVFDSGVINELLDELHGPRMHPRNRLERARHRSWIAYSHELLQAQTAAYAAPSRKVFNRRIDGLRQALVPLEKALTAEPFFSGRTFSLVDATYAPLFLRSRIMEAHCPEFARLVSDPLASWADALLAYPAVQAAVPNGFERSYRAFIRNKGSWLLSHG